METKKTYAWLLAVNLFISTFTFGGGYVVVPMIRRFYVLKRHCFSEEELMNMAAVAQSTPGAIAMNLSALAGYRTAGIKGLLISCVAALIPPLVILSIISSYYSTMISNTTITAVLKGMEAGLTALMVDLIVDMCRMITKQNSPFLTAMIPAVFLAHFFLHIPVSFLLITCCLLCILRVFYDKKKGNIA